MNRWTWAAAVLAAVAAAATPASAKDEGFSTVNFRPATDPFGYASVNGARSLDMFQLHAAGWLNWAKNPLQTPDGAVTTNGKDILKEVTTVDIVAGLGLLKFGDGGLQI